MEWRARLRRLSRPVNTFQVVALRRLQQLLLAPTDALPLDLFRIAVGLLAVAYLLRAAFEAPYFSSPDGLIDHELSEEIFPYTIQPLFRPWMTIGLVRAILGVSCLLAFGIVFGIAPRICAFVLYVVVACWYRFHFLTVYVDDSLLHLWLLWVALMPVGATLTVGSWFRGRPELAGWAKQQVPGASVRLFLGNIALMYFVAGTTKWTSRLWLEGNALYAVLKLPAAWFPEFWQEWHLPALVLFNYAALIVEPLLALIVFLPTGRPLKKWLGAGLVLLHVGVIATFDAPFANLACLAATLLIFRHEIIGFLVPGRFEDETPAFYAPRRWRPTERFGALVLVLLTITMLLSMRPSGWRKPSRGSNATATAKTHADDGLTGDALETSFYGTLWVLGLAQQFRSSVSIRYDQTLGGAARSSRISNLELRLQHGTRSLLLNATTLPRKAGHDGIRRGPVACSCRPVSPSRCCSANWSHTPPTLLPQRPDFLPEREGPNHPAQVAPRSDAACRRTACGSDGLRPAAASNTARA